MTESKIELHDRLRRQGKWSEAASWKDVRIKELRAQGMKRAEAGDEAWRLMAEKYPPPPPVPVPDDDEWDDDDLDYDEEPEWDDDDEFAPWMIATAREWLDDPKTCSDPDSPFHETLRRLARDKALINAYFGELVRREDQHRVPPSAASEAETGQSVQA